MRMAKTRWFFYVGLVLALAALFCTGCAKSQGGSGTVTLEETKRIFDAAKFTGAANKSPYEFYSAEIFLKKAMEEKDLGNIKLVDKYLTKAHEQARIAYDNAKKYQRAK